MLQLLSFNNISMIVMTLFLMAQMSLQAPATTIGSLNVNGPHSPHASMNHAAGTPRTTVHGHGNGAYFPGPIAHTSNLPVCSRCNVNPCKCLNNTL